MFDSSAMNYLLTYFLINTTDRSLRSWVPGWWLLSCAQ